MKKKSNNMISLAHVGLCRTFASTNLRIAVMLSLLLYYVDLFPKLESCSPTATFLEVYAFRYADIPLPSDKIIYKFDVNYILTIST